VGNNEEVISTCMNLRIESKLRLVSAVIEDENLPNSEAAHRRTSFIIGDGREDNTDIQEDVVREARAP
jgi:hypothetical protein